MYKKIINKLLKRYQLKNIPTDKKVVYLTFDDGPENSITQYVLDELDMYGFKATFFCRGDNAEKNPQLLDLLRAKGHSIGNHTYSHVHAYDTSTKDYLADVERADGLLHTALLRPPHGCLTLGTWLKLRKKYKLVYWALNSEDSAMELYDYKKAIVNLKTNIQHGDVILFHFCHRHEKETRQLLPEYLAWLREQGYHSDAIFLQ